MYTPFYPADMVVTMDKIFTCLSPSPNRDPGQLNLYVMIIIFDEAINCLSHCLTDMLSSTR